MIDQVLAYDIGLELIAKGQALWQPGTGVLRQLQWEGRQATRVPATGNNRLLHRIGSPKDTSGAKEVIAL